MEENLISVRQWIDSQQNKGHRGKRITESWCYYLMRDAEKTGTESRLPFKFKKIAGHYFIVDESEK